MFFNCSSLISLPDISKWNTSKVRYSNMTFENCFSTLNLFHLPKLFSERITNDDNLNNNFYDFITINYFSDISPFFINILIELIKKYYFK